MTHRGRCHNSRRPPASVVRRNQYTEVSHRLRSSSLTSVGNPVATVTEDERTRSDVLHAGLAEVLSTSRARSIASSVDARHLLDSAPRTLRQLRMRADRGIFG